MKERDIVVIGGGPAGYVSAIRAAQLGAKVTLVEEKKLGGVCLNCGCIPTKFLLHSVDLYQSMRTADQYGIGMAEVNLDLSKLQARKNRIVSTLISGIQSLLAGNSIEVINGHAKLASLNHIEIDSGQEEKQTIQARKIILATGSKAVKLPVFGADSPDIMDSDSLLSLNNIPKSLAIIGGGVVGIEIATIFTRLGCKVSILEMMPNIVPGQDAELVSVLEGALVKEGIEIYCGASLERIEDTEGGKLIIFSFGKEVKKIRVEIVVVCVGRKPNIEGLGLSEFGVVVANGRIQTDVRMQTNVSNIYAAGDVVGGIMLAHVAFAEGMVAADNAMGRNAVIDYQVVPQCIFTAPELASVGLTEEEAITKGYKIKVGRFPFSANGMAAVLGETRGMAKIITEQKYSRILGVHVIGPGASSLIPEAVLAMKLDATPQDISSAIHIHPTLSEVMMEAAMAVTGESIHFMSST